MKNNNITQEKLAEILGISQPNVSKALSLKSRKNFTLDQVIGIANYFGVSIDFLIGNDAAKSQEIGLRSVAEFLLNVIERHDAKYTSVQFEELVYKPTKSYDTYYRTNRWDTLEEKHANTYLAIYFPDYWQLPDPLTVDRKSFAELYSRATQDGNETRMKPLNSLLRKFIQVFEDYENKGVDKKTYRTSIDNYLSKLNDQ